MAFWTDASLDPVRKYRFRVSTYSPVGDEIYWYAKTVDKPSIDINTSEYQITNHKFKFPGIATWNDITLTYVDIGGRAMDTLKTTLVRQGWHYPIQPSNEDGFRKNPDKIGPRNFIIQQFDGAGEQIEEWKLHSAFIKSVNFGSLAYSDDELVEISVVIAYDFATLDVKIDSSVSF